jgi:hypothetical protein
MTMNPEKTNYITQGYDGLKRLRQGPSLDSYRGLNIIHSRQYSLETGAPPRDLLRRRVRVAEYYRIPPPSLFAMPVGGGAIALDQGRINNLNIELYDESKDTFFTTTWKELLLHAALDEEDRTKMMADIEIARTPFADVTSNLIPNNIVIPPAAPGGPAVNGNNRDVMLALRQRLAGGGMDANGGALILRNFATVQQWDAGQAGAGADIRREEIRTFYYASGMCPPIQAPFAAAFQAANALFQAAGQGEGAILFKGQPVPANNDQNRRRLFCQLMRGWIDGGGAHGDIHTGMRPNLHVGNMTFATMKPESIRFVHVAANIFSQIVVMKETALRLMAQLVGWDAAAAPPARPDAANNQDLALAHTVLLDLYDIQPDPDQVYFGVDCSVLVYLVGAALHPNADIRSKCKEVLHRLAGMEVDKFAEELTAFIKAFIHGAPKFNAFAQVLLSSGLLFSAITYNMCT